MMLVLLLTSVLSSILAAVLGPIYAWHRSKGFERQLGETTQAVKAVATKHLEKRASVASLTKGLPPPVQRYFERSLRDQRQFRLGWTAPACKVAVHSPCQCLSWCSPLRHWGPATPPRLSVTNVLEACSQLLESAPAPRPGLHPALPAPCLCSLWTARTVGELRFDAKSKWKHIDAITVGLVAEPAFTYTGTLQLGPGSLLWCRGQEGYVGSKGRMEWRLWGAVRLAKQEGPRLDQNALLRYLAGKRAAC